MNKKNFKELLEEISTSFTAKVNYLPSVEALFTKDISEDNLIELSKYIKKLQKSDETIDLALIIRRYSLDFSANLTLKSAQTKSNPLKAALKNPAPPAQPAIQIQKVFKVEDKKAVQDANVNVEVEADDLPLSLEALTLPDNLAVLAQQLKSLDISNIHTKAKAQILAHQHAFKDGIIPSNLPKGFYIDKTKAALCFSKEPRKLPTALAPDLKITKALLQPTLEQAKFLCKNIPESILNQLLDDSNVEAQKSGFINLFAPDTKEILSFFATLSPEHTNFLVPLLAKQFIYGGLTHSKLFINELKSLITKNVDLNFLKSPITQNQLLSANSIKSLKKLASLPIEQRVWWSKLVSLHIESQDFFDFSKSFEAYIHVFIPAIKKKKLTLPNPCPITYKGHFQITLNRILEVIENSANPQEQCRRLDNLSWNFSGAHFALTALKPRFKQADERMGLDNVTNFNNDLNAIFAKLPTNENIDQWFYRYIGQHWTSHLTLHDVDAELLTIEKLLWSQEEKNRLKFIFAVTFPFTESNSEHLASLISLLSSVDETTRKTILAAQSSCYNFQPTPSLNQICQLTNASILAFSTFPATATNFSNTLKTVLEKEGFDFYTTLRERILKFSASKNSETEVLKALASYIQLVDANRDKILANAPLIKLLVALSDDILTQEQLDTLFIALQDLNTKKGEDYKKAFLGVLSKINIPKSQKLPSFAQIIQLITELSKPNIAANTAAISEQVLQEEVLASQILPPETVVGAGNVAQLNNLIVTAFVDATDLRAELLDVNYLRKLITTKINTSPVPFLLKSELLKQLETSLFPVMTQINDLMIELIGDHSSITKALVKSLDSTKNSIPNPSIDIVLDRLSKIQAANPHPKYDALVQHVKKMQGNPMFVGVDNIVWHLEKFEREPAKPSFEIIIKHLEKFEKEIPGLLEASYPIIKIPVYGVLSPHGKNVLSLLSTGKLKEGETEDAAVVKPLSIAHNKLKEFFKTFFAEPTNQKKFVGLDDKKLFSWLQEFNDNKSILFIFKEELLERKIRPAIQNTLLELNSKDSEFEKSILEAATTFDETLGSSSESLKEYQIKIRNIELYLNLLSSLKINYDYQFFQDTYKQLQQGSLSRLNFTHKQELLDLFLKNYPADEIKDKLPEYLNLISDIVQKNNTASTKDFTRAVSGVKTFFALGKLTPESQNLFKMSFAHNLRSEIPFPLEAIHTLSIANTNPATPLLIKQLITILGYMKEDDAQEVQLLINRIKVFVNAYPQHISFCTELLKRFSSGSSGKKNAQSFTNIIYEIMKDEVTAKDELIKILTNLASAKQDNAANLPLLLEILSGLVRRPDSIPEVANLFATRPFPRATALNFLLLKHTSAELSKYCKEFDADPFAKSGKVRDLEKQFVTDRIAPAIKDIKDMLPDVELSPTEQANLARQLTYLNLLGYNPSEFNKGKKQLVHFTRAELKTGALQLMAELKNSNKNDPGHELLELKVLAYLREIYFRTVSPGIFPYTTQMLVLLLAMRNPELDLLMSIKTGEGKSIIAPMLTILESISGGTIISATANKTLLYRDYEKFSEPFFQFFGDKSSGLIEPQQNVLHDLNNSTFDDTALFVLSELEKSKDKKSILQKPFSLIVDECDDHFLDKTTPELYALIKEEKSAINHAEWIYPLTHAFMSSDLLKSLDESAEIDWDDDDLIEKFRLFLNSEIAAKFAGDAKKQIFANSLSPMQLKQLISVSCQAATLVENKHFLIHSVKTETDFDSHTTMKCIPIINGAPKNSCVLVNGLQQALEARVIAEFESKGEPHNLKITPDAKVLATLSAHGLLAHCKKSGGRIIGISGTPGNIPELQNLEESFAQFGSKGLKVLGFPPHFGDHRIVHPTIFVTSFEDRIKAISKWIDKIKVPKTEAYLKLDPDASIETLEELDNFVASREHALEEWSKTQTRSILIVCDDFDDSKKTAASLEHYKKEGFTIIVTDGKESDEEYSKIIKNAGKPNYITIITDTRGVDINTGDHPDGLAVFQPFITTSRITNQVKGRTARNGKPGDYVPFYQLPAEKNIFKRMLYAMAPWWKRNLDNKAIQTIQADLVYKSTIARIYTQAVAEAQQILMEKVEAWEKLLINLHSKKIVPEIYEWRINLLAEISSLQEQNIKEENLDASIENFKTALCKLWEENQTKWQTKAETAIADTSDENLAKFSYLKTASLSKELDSQKLLQKKHSEVVEATQTLTEQTLESIILDQAGAKLHYEQTELTADQISQLKLDQCQQLLPDLIAELCFVYPPSLKQFRPQSDSSLSLSAFLPDFANSFIDIVIEQKNKILPQDKEKFKKAIINIVKEDIKKSSNKTEELQKLLTMMYPLIISYNEQLKKKSLVDQFKMQGLLNGYTKLYKQIGLVEENNILDNLAKSNTDQMMVSLADYLCAEFKWSIKPSGIHRVERKVAIETAKAIYEKAAIVKANHATANSQKEDIDELLALIHKQEVILKPMYLFSLGHSSPHKVLKTALAAIDAFTMTSEKDKNNYKHHRETALVSYHKNSFSKLLTKLSKPYNQKNDKVWGHLRIILEQLSTTSKNSNAAQLLELDQTLQRFALYDTYKPYKKTIAALRSRLKKSLAVLKENGFEETMEEELFEQLKQDFLPFFKGSSSIKIQRKFNGVKSYIEMQTDSKALQDGFKKYESSEATNSSLAESKAKLEAKILFLETNKDKFLNLTDANLLDGEFPFPKVIDKLKDLYKLKAWLDSEENFKLENSNLLLPPKLQKYYAIYKKLINIQDYNEIQAIVSPLDENDSKDTELKNAIAVLQSYYENLEKEKKPAVITKAKTIFPLFKPKVEIPAPTTNPKVELLNGLIKGENEKIEKFVKDSILVHLQQESSAIITKLETELEVFEKTLVDISISEGAKSKYQTIKFTDQTSLLKFAAKVKKEEDLVNKLSGSKQGLFKPVSPDNPSGSDVELGDAPGLA